MNRGIWGLAGAVALAIAGCGGSSKTVTVTAPVKPTSTTSSASSPLGPTTTTTGGHTTATLTQTITPTLHLTTFQSPSGNIGCIIAGGIARCDIKRRSWSPPGRPSSCPNVVDFGQGLELGSSGPGRFVCAGDTALDPTAPKLAYGKGTSVGKFVCLSATSGVTCTNTPTGHGFFISIQSYKVY